MIMGMSSGDRCARASNVSISTEGTPSGQSFYVTASKSLKHQTGLPLAPYVGVAYGTFEDRARVIGGLNISFSDGWSSTILFDGVRVHPLLALANGLEEQIVDFLLAIGNLVCGPGTLPELDSHW